MSYGITNHAVERFRERVKPALGFAAAKDELSTLLRLGTPHADPPEWIFEASTGTEGFVELADGIAAALKRGDVTTVLTRGGCNPSHRQHKKERKAKRRAMKRQRSASSKPPKSLRREGSWAERP